MSTMTFTPSDCNENDQEIGFPSDGTDSAVTSMDCESKDISLSQCRRTGSLADDLLDDEVNPLSSENDEHRVNEPVEKSSANYKTQHNQFDINAQTIVDANIEETNSQDTNVMSIDGSRDIGVITTAAKTTSKLLYPISDQLHRLTTTNPLLFNQQSQPPNHKSWDHLIRSGTRIKTLLSDAIDEVKTTIVTLQSNTQNKRARDETNNSTSNEKIDVNESPTNKSSRVVTVADFTVELAREKTAQVMQLQRVRIPLSPVDLLTAPRCTPYLPVR
jgi:hypothetical protein